MESCLFPTRVGFFFFIVNMIKVLFTICALNWGVLNYVSRQGKSIKRKTRNTIFINYEEFFKLDHKLTVKIVTSHLSEHLFR